MEIRWGELQYGEQSSTLPVWGFLLYHTKIEKSSILYGLNFQEERHNLPLIYYMVPHHQKTVNLERLTSLTVTTQSCNALLIQLFSDSFLRLQLKILDSRTSSIYRDKSHVHWILVMRNHMIKLSLKYVWFFPLCKPLRWYIISFFYHFKNLTFWDK